MPNTALKKGTKFLKCDYCDYSTLYSRSIRKHIRVHKGDEYKCEHCDYTTGWSSALKMHKRIHTGEKPFKCELCDYKSRLSHNLTRHVIYHHTTEKPHACQRCHYRAKNLSEVKLHQTRMHSNDVERSCSEQNCKFTCRVKSTMKQHHTSVYTHIFPKYACHLCEERYDTDAKLTKHMTNTHSFLWPSVQIPRMKQQPLV